MGQPGPLTDVCAGPETFLDVLARRSPDDPLVTFPGSGTFTTGAVLQVAEDAARRLTGLGLRPGEAVITCLRPGLTLLSLVGGVARAGLVEVPLALDVTAASARDLAALTGTRVALIGRAALAGNPALRSLAGNARLVLLDDGPAADAAEEALEWDDVPRGGLPRPPGPEDAALVMSTSGTTGRPKGVVLPHFAGVRHARRVATSMRYGPGDVLYNAFPWNHINIRHAGFGAALISGGRLVAVPKFSASSFWELCRSEGVTAFNFMGAVAAILLRGAPTRDHQVTRAYGGPAPAWLASAFSKQFGVRLIEAYACTELGDVASNTVDDVVPGTAGWPLPEYELRLLDEAGTPVPAGEVGRITVRPRAVGLTALSHPAEEWFSTGDLGRLVDGRLVYAGRSDDVVRRRGENISTWEVESVLGALPGVREAAAVGVPSELTEDDLLVAVVPSGALTAAQIHAWCRDRLPRHAWPRYVTLLDALPRNAATKVRKSELRSTAGAVDFDPKGVRDATGPGFD